MDTNNRRNIGRPSRSMDGFMPQRRTPARDLSQFSIPKPDAAPAVAAPILRSSQSSAARPIDLTGIDKESAVQKKGFFRRRAQSDRTKLYKKYKTKKIAKLIVLCALIGVAGFGVYFGWKVISNLDKVFKGNVLGAVTSTLAPDIPLKTDQYGNTNVLALGTSESDPNHPGAQLTDSMMIISFNQATHSAFLLSVPRDLWVHYDSASCSVGYSGKINAVYECGYNGASGASSGNESDGESAAANKVSSVFGINVQYVVHLNLAVVQKAVDAVGGIDIVIQSPDPRGILDRNFDWRCNYRCYLVKYPNGPAHLNGTQAMWLVQARNDAGGYGLPRSNFDREANQRKVLLALKDKAMSVGFLANPLNVINMLDALGNNVHTTIDTSEIKSFIDATKSIPTSNVTSFDILNDASGILTTGIGPDGSSIVEPTAGLYDYTQLQALTDKLLAGHAALIAEGAKVDVLNGSGVSGAAMQEAAVLQKDGLTIGNVSTAPSSFSSTSKYTLFDLSKGSKPATLSALQSALGVKATKATLPAGISTTSQFVIILGNTSDANNTGQ